MKNLKIGFVLDDSIDRPDGVQQYLYTLSDYFIHQGHQVYFLSGQSSGQISHSYSLAKNLTVRFNRNVLSIPIYANKVQIKNILADLNLDILHFQLPFSPILSRQIIKLSPKTVKFGTFHIYSERKLENFASKILNLMIHRSIKQLDLIYALSKPAQDFAFNNFKIKSQVLAVPIKLDKFSFKLEHDDQIKLVFLGRLVERKNCQLFIRAINLLALSQPDLNFQAQIIGDGPLKQSLKKMVSSYGLQNRIKFTGFVDENRKFKLLAQADLAVFPSLGSESFGIVLLEALSVQHPIVLASNNPGYSSVFHSLPNNLFDPNDAQQLSLKLKAFIFDKIQIQKTLKKQLELLNQFDVDTIGARILTDYNKILRKYKKS